MTGNSPDSTRDGHVNPWVRLSKLVIFHEAIDCAVQSTKPTKDARRNAGDRLWRVYVSGAACLLRPEAAVVVDMLNIQFEFACLCDDILMGMR